MLTLRQTLVSVLWCLGIALVLGVALLSNSNLRSVLLIVAMGALIALGYWYARATTRGIAELSSSDREVFYRRHGRADLARLEVAMRRTHCVTLRSRGRRET